MTLFYQMELHHVGKFRVMLDVCLPTEDVYCFTADHAAPLTPPAAAPA